MILDAASEVSFGSSRYRVGAGGRRPCTTNPAVPSVVCRTSTGLCVEARIPGVAWAFPLAENISRFTVVDLSA